MAEELCFFHKEANAVKTQKKTKISLRTIILTFSLIFGLYICSICVKQSAFSIHENLVGMVVGRKCPSSKSNHGPQSVHYPLPRTFSRKECSCNPVRFFVIISMQRSGSGWFETLLNSHINVSSNGEIFSVRERRNNMTAIEHTLDRVYTLDWMSSAAKNECTAAVGFKWMLNQGLMEHPGEITEYFNRRGVMVIFLFRKNLLRRMVSLIANSHDRSAKLLNGTHKSHVHSKDEAAILASYRPFVDTTHLISDLKESKKSINQTLNFFKGTRHIILYYEDLISNRTKLVDVQDFLGVPHCNLSSRQVKIHTSPLSEQIENWGDVRDAINGTEYENFITADYHL